MDRNESSGAEVLRRIRDLRTKAFERTKKFPTKLYVSKLDENSLLTLQACDVGSTIVGQITRDGVPAALPTIYGMNVTYGTDRTDVEFQ